MEQAGDQHAGAGAVRVPPKTAAELLAFPLTLSTEDFVGPQRGRRVRAARLVAELLLRLTEIAAAVKRPG
jgi:hypothetical protein